MQPAVPSADEPTAAPHTLETNAPLLESEGGRLKRLHVAVFATATAMYLVAAVPVVATAATTLALTGYGDMVVDAAHGHVFVTGGSGDSSIVVLDFSGNIVTTITGQGGAGEMVLDGSTLYVALSQTTEISRVNTATLAEIDRFSVAPGPAPQFLAKAAGRLWFSACSDGGGFASITPGGSDLKQYEDRCAIFASSPTDPSLLAVGSPGGSPATVEILNVSTDPPTSVISGSPPGNESAGSSNLQDMTITPDGLRLLVACGYPYFHQAILLSDLSRAAKYDTSNYPNAVAISPDGQYVAAGIDNFNGSDVYLFTEGSSTPHRVHQFDPTAAVFARGLAFSPNGRAVFAVSSASFGTVTFEALSNRLLTTLTLDRSKSVVNHGGSLTLTAQLSPAGTESRHVAIYATPYGGTKTLVKSDAVDSQGRLTATVKPKAKTTYSATFLGSEKYEPATSSGTTVLVRAITKAVLGGYYRTSGTNKLFHLGRLVKQTGSVVPNHARKKLKFIAQRRRNGAWRTLAVASFRMRANGAVSAYFAPRVKASYRVRNEFAGDIDHLGSVSPWRYFKVTS